MKRFSVLFVLLSIVLSSFAQEYYYWYKNGKIPLELSPRKKFITIKDPSDTTDLKIRLFQKNYKYIPFEKEYIFKPKFVQKDYDWYTIIESVDSLPTLSSDTSVLYESPCFFSGPQKAEIQLTHMLYVKLKRAEDSSILVNKAKEFNLTIYAKDNYMPLWYYLACTKTSKGNAMQVANSLYETNLFEATEPEFFGTVYHTSAINSAINTKFERSQNVLYKINASNLEISSTDDPIVFIRINSLDGKSIYNKHYPCKTETNVELRGIKGLYLLTVKLHSGFISRDKILIQ